MYEYSRIFHKLQNDEPLLALNVIIGVFTVVSFTKLCIEICSYSKATQSRALALHNELCNELREIRVALEQLNERVSFMEQQQVDCSQSSHSSQSTQSSQSSQTNESQNDVEPLLAPTAPEAAPTAPEATITPVAKQVNIINEISPVNPKQADKHSQLIASMKNNEEVSMTYKKQPFTATFIVKVDAQHGYVLKSGTAEYNTPSHFSHAKKVAINDKIKSDNGWDTVTVNRNGNKLTLNELINGSAQQI